MSSGSGIPGVRTGVSDHNPLIIDSDILIDFTHGDERAVKWLDAQLAVHSNLRISVVSSLELIVGSRDKRHLRDLTNFLARFETVHINDEISSKALELVAQYFLSHGLLIADAFIASTTILLDEQLATKNHRDFRFIDGLSLVAYP